jgi:GDPmannose 4,6-dehydratase
MEVPEIVKMSTFKNLSSLGIKNGINLISVNVNDFRSILQSIIKIKPDKINNLSGQSSVGLTFEQPFETLESISIGTLNIDKSIRFSNTDIKFYNAGSREYFGD